ncbi:MAG: TauD/TfdA family dioxygenase [Flavobacteriales bacterium]|nr:TauD/TfdA family dioxygenase [Flavobacteriales bacterium]
MNLPHTITSKGPDSVIDLIGLIEGQRDLIHTDLLQNGSVLFRGFKVHSPEDFEQVATALRSDLQNNYQGTSPRNSRTTFVHSASELPGHYPIMQHCEMSFLPTAPRYLLFFCHVQPSGGGQTPVCDFRKVYEQLDPTVREEFERKGVRYVRNYSGPLSKKGLDLFQLKPWHELFKTTDRTEVERQCAETGLRATWLPDDRLRLENDRPAMLRHPDTGEMVWFNHLQVFHKEAAAIEYGHILRHRKDWMALKYATLLQLATLYKRMFKDPMSEAMHVLYGDGSPIPTAHVKHVEDIIWKNLKPFDWQLGDVLMIDNFSTSHGRLPYQGPRDILVAWTS